MLPPHTPTRPPHSKCARALLPTHGTLCHCAIRVVSSISNHANADIHLKPRQRRLTPRHPRRPSIRRLEPCHHAMSIHPLSTPQVEPLLDELGARGRVQVAHFHPRYQFAGTAPDDAENLTNRAPHPTLHFLREAEVRAAPCRAVGCVMRRCAVPRDGVRPVVAAHHTATLTLLLGDSMMPLGRGRSCCRSRTIVGGGGARRGARGR